MKKLIRSFGYAFNGIRLSTLTQLNFRVHLTAAVLAVSIGYWLHISTTEWLWVILCITFVMVTEMLNTAIEFLTDLVSPQYNELAGKVKDVSAGAVLISAIFALVTGTIIFLPKFLALIHHAA